MALRRPLALAAVLAGLGAGFGLGAATGGHTSTASAGPCPLSTPTSTCSTATEPTVTNPAPVATLQLSVPKSGFVVRRGRFRITCRLAGGSGRCSVTARRSGTTVGSGRRTLSGGRARVSVRLGSAAAATLRRTHRMRVNLVGRADGRRTTATATLRAG